MRLTVRLKICQVWSIQFNFKIFFSAIRRKNWIFEIRIEKNHKLILKFPEFGIQFKNDILPTFLGFIRGLIAMARSLLSSFETGPPFPMSSRPCASPNIFEKSKTSRKSKELLKKPRWGKRENVGNKSMNGVNGNEDIVSLSRLLLSLTGPKFSLFSFSLFSTNYRS